MSRDFIMVGKRVWVELGKRGLLVYVKNKIIKLILEIVILIVILVSTVITRIYFLLRDLVFFYISWGGILFVFIL